MITIRMMAENDSDRMILAVDGLKGSEMEVFAAMMAGIVGKMQNIDFKNLGNCSDLEPMKIDSEPISVPETLTKNPASVSAVPSAPETVTDSMVETISADDEVFSNSKKSDASPASSVAKRSTDPSEKIPLNISYEERETAKNLLRGLIRWDQKAKHWYCLQENLEKVIEKASGWKAKEDLVVD